MTIFCLLMCTDTKQLGGGQIVGINYDNNKIAIGKFDARRRQWMLFPWLVLMCLARHLDGSTRHLALGRALAFGVSRTVSHVNCTILSHLQLAIGRHRPAVRSTIQVSGQLSLPLWQLTVTNFSNTLYLQWACFHQQPYRVELLAPVYGL